MNNLMKLMVKCIREQACVINDYTKIISYPYISYTFGREACKVLERQGKADMLREFIEGELKKYENNR